MDNLSRSLSNSSWENPFGLSGNIGPCDLESDEQFVGDELKAFFDKEEKLYQSASSVKSDQSHQTEKSNAMVSGITLRSFMVESGDSDLIQQKLTMSQYLAYKSEPMGPELGDSASFRERPYFSFQEKSLQSSSSEKSEPGLAEFNPDFSQEPSWMKKKSLSSLSSSENLEIPSKSPDSSENWLIGKNKSTSKSSLVDNMEKSSSSFHINEPSIQHFEGNHFTPVEFKQTAPCLALQEVGETSELPSLYWKPHDESNIDVGQSHLESILEKEAISNCHSYVAGHVESLSVGSDISRRPSEIAASSQSSSSPASTIRENTDFPRCDSVISEPQLSSTREITDDYTDLSSSEKHVHFLPNPQHAEISHISMETQNLQLGSLLEVSSKPNLCSTAMTPAAKASEHVMRILANLSKKGNITADHEQENQLVTPRVNQVSEVETTSRNLNLEWELIERELTQCDPNGFSPESWVAVFSNTSSLSTPLLMNKIKEHVLRLNGRGMSSEILPSESSGIGGSGFEITESRTDSAYGPQSHKSTDNFIRQSLVNNNGISSRTSSEKFNPPQHKPTEPKQQPVIPVLVPTTPTEIDVKITKSRHTLPVMPTRSTVNRDLQTPIEGLAKGEFNEKDFARLTSTVIKKIPVPDIAKPSIGVTRVKANLIESQQSHEGPLVKCNKSQVYFGGARIRHTQFQSVVVRNSSFKQELDLDLRIKESDDFFLLDEKRSLVSRRNFQLQPRQECCLDLVFQPHCLGPLTTKLNLYPRCESASKVKYTVDLFGYGGSSHIQHLGYKNTGPKNTLVPKSKGASWNCQLVLENRGNVAGFAFIQPLQENGNVMESYQCIVMPQCCSMNAGDTKDIQIFIHPSKDGKLTSLKLRLVWGDEPLRARWINCIVNGAPITPTSEINEFDWTRLLQLDCKDNPLKPAVSEEDMALFFNNATVEEISVIIPEHGHDSHFVTLAVEPATVLEPSTVSDTLLSHRRLTNTNRPSSDLVVSVAVTELVFPSTKVGTVSSQKIPLQNWSGAKQEVRVKEIIGPFTMKHARNAVPGGYFTRLPIQFHPNKSGSHCGCVILDVGQNGQSLTIALKGDAY